MRFDYKNASKSECFLLDVMSKKFDIYINSHIIK